MKKRLVLGVLALGSITACTPAQTRAWLAWWEEDPQAAEDWARNECGELCTHDWDNDGVVEPEPSADTSDSSADAESSDDSAVSEEAAPVPEYDGDEGQDTAGVYWPWDALAQCESNGNWSIDTGNGYYGGLQFSWGSWEAAGGSGNPAHASPSEQVYRGEILQDMQGWGAWPTCARIIGLL